MAELGTVTCDLRLDASGFIRDLERLLAAAKQIQGQKVPAAERRKSRKPKRRRVRG